MASTRKFLAFDLGAESGRALLGTIEGGERLSLEEKHRFANPNGRMNGHLHWNLLAQWEEPGLMRPNHMADSEGSAWDAYVWIDNADELYAEFRSKGVTIAREICDQFYGCRDFDVEDCNGYRLCFGQDLES